MLKTTAELYKEINTIIENNRGFWHDGTPYDGDFTNILKECTYIFATADIIKEYFQIECGHGYDYKDRILWRINSYGCAEAMPEVTEIIMSLMYDAVLVNPISE